MNARKRKTDAPRAVATVEKLPALLTFYRKYIREHNCSVPLKRLTHENERQSVSQSVSVGQSVSRTVSQLVSQSVTRSISQSVGRSVNQSVSNVLASQPFALEAGVKAHHCVFGLADSSSALMMLKSIIHVP